MTSIFQEIELVLKFIFEKKKRIVNNKGRKMQINQSTELGDTHHIGPIGTITSTLFLW